MAVNSQNRLGGWLLLPLAWLIMTLLSTTLVMFMFMSALLDPALRQSLFSLQSNLLFQWVFSVLTSVVVWAYSIWVTVLFFKRSKRLPRHYIIWLLLTVLLALKVFAFSPVADDKAVQTLLIALLAAAALVPYFKRAERVKTTFINP